LNRGPRFSCCMPYFDFNELYWELILALIIPPYYRYMFFWFDFRLVNPQINLVNKIPQRIFCLSWVNNPKWSDPKGFSIFPLFIKSLKVKNMIYQRYWSILLTIDNINLLCIHLLLWNLHHHMKIRITSPTRFAIWIGLFTSKLFIVYNTIVLRFCIIPSSNHHRI
jgi:hypothetical protein